MFSLVRGSFPHLASAVFLALAATSSAALTDCDFRFEIDSQSSAFQALVDGAAERGGFWRPIREAPDDVQALGRFVGRLDVCLMTPDGKPREIVTARGTVTLNSPYVTSCTAALLPGNRLLTNRHCYYEPSLVRAGFSRVREARINFGYTSRDFTGAVQTFLVDDRELAADEATDALLLQVIGGDANAALGGHIPMVMSDDTTPRRALTMIHHPKGDPQQFSSGTCQVHPEQAALPSEATQLRHSCESTGGSSGSLLLDARTLAVVGLHNQGGLSALGGYNGGHRISAVAAALGLDFKQSGVVQAAPDPEVQALEALAVALGESDPAQRVKALQSVIVAFPASTAARSAEGALDMTKRNDAPVDSGKPTVVTVRADGTGDYVSIAEAVRGVAPEGTVEVFPGLYQEALRIHDTVSILGVGAREDIVIEASADPVVTWRGEWGEVRNLTLRQVGDAHPVVLFDTGSAQLSDLVIEGTGGQRGVVVTRNGYPFPSIYDSLFHKLDNGAHLDVNGAEFVGNRFAGTADGILSRDVSSLTIEDNSFAVMRTAITLTGKGGAHILENRITGGTRGIAILGRESDHLIHDNRIEGLREVGLELGDGTGPTIRSNAIVGTPVGIRVADFAWPVVHANRIEGARAAIEIGDNGQGDYTENDMRLSDRGIVETGKPDYYREKDNQW